MISAIFVTGILLESLPIDKVVSLEWALLVLVPGLPFTANAYALENGEDMVKEVSWLSWEEEMVESGYASSAMK